MCCWRIGTSHRLKKIQATPTEQDLGTSGGLSKISDAHPRPFYMEVPTGVSGSCDVALTV